MMSYLFYAACTLFLIILQTTFLVHVPLFDRFYDLVILLIVYIGLYHKLLEGAFVAVAIGILMEGISGGAFGLYITIYIWVFFSVRWLTQYFHAGSIFLLPIVIGVGAIVESLVFLLMALIWLEGRMNYSSAMVLMGYQILWAIFTGPFVIMSIQSLHLKWRKYSVRLSSKIKNSAY